MVAMPQSVKQVLTHLFEGAVDEVAQKVKRKFPDLEMEGIKDIARIYLRHHYMEGVSQSYPTGHPLVRFVESL